MWVTLVEMAVLRISQGLRAWASSTRKPPGLCAGRLQSKTANTRGWCLREPNRPRLEMAYFLCIHIPEVRTWSHGYTSVHGRLTFSLSVRQEEEKMHFMSN